MSLDAKTPAGLPPRSPALGRLVYVMGPSGVGKDTVLGLARQQLMGCNVLFAHRYITRPPIAGDENFIALSMAEFAERRALGLFAIAWEARGVHYALGIEIDLWRSAGATVVVSGSRDQFVREMTERPGVLPVLIAADAAVIAARLVARAREDDGAIAERRARGVALTVAHPLLVTIDNSGPAERAGNHLAEVIRQAAAATGRGS